MFLPYLAVPWGMLMLLNLISFLLHFLKGLKGRPGRAVTLLIVSSSSSPSLSWAIHRGLHGVTGMVYFLLTSGFDYFPWL